MPSILKSLRKLLLTFSLQKRLPTTAKIIPSEIIDLHLQHTICRRSTLCSCFSTMSARNPLGNLDVNDGQMFYFTTPLQARGNKRTMEGRSSTAAESLKNTGRWTEWEKLAFLKGLRLHGRGNWKKISSMIPTRNTIQIKTHAQVLLKKYDEGEYIYDELDRHYQSRRQEVMVPAPIRTRDFDNRLSAMRLFPHPDEATAAFAMLVLSRGEDVN